MAWIARLNRGPVTDPPKPEVLQLEVKPNMAATSETLLQRIGGFFKKVFGAIVGVGVAIEPIIAVALPGISNLYDTTIQLIANAEMAAAAAGNQTGSGPQKLAAVVASLEPLAIQYFATQHIKADTAVITKWVNAVVASLNAIPAPTTPAPSTTA